MAYGKLRKNSAMNLLGEDVGALSVAGRTKASVLARKRKQFRMTALLGANTCAAVGEHATV